jgi:hypothetical protein
VGLRLWWFAFYDRSLWADEAALATNLVNRDFLGLLKPLDFDQSAPIGVLWAVKATISGLGVRETTLRLVPFLASLVSLFLFYALAKRLLTGAMLVLAIGFFALAERLIYYAAELKQYGIDVLVALCIALPTVAALQRSEFRPRDVWLVAIAGSVGVWFSHPALFVSVGAFVALTWSAVERAGGIQRVAPEVVLTLALGFSALLLSFVVDYLFFLRATAQNKTFLTFWESTFLKLPLSMAAIKQNVYLLYFYVQYPFKLNKLLSAGLLLVLVAGIVRMWREHRAVAVFLIVPILLAAGASVVSKYGFGDRLLLYCVPATVLFLASGVGYLYQLPKISDGVGHTVVAGLLLALGLQTIAMVREPPSPSHLRPVMQEVAKRGGESNLAFVHRSGLSSFRFYNDTVKQTQFTRTLRPLAYTEVLIEPEMLTQFPKGEPIWLFFDRCSPAQVQSYEQFLNDYGTKVDAVIGRNSAALLYEFNRN